MARDGSKTGGGSRKGVPNRSTARAREAIAAFVDNNADTLQALLEEIRVENGALAAFNCIRDLIEYHVPKLSRAEHQPLDANGEKSGGFTVTIEHVTKKDGA